MLYVFGGLLGRPMRLLSSAMRDFGQGDLDRRIADARNDEFGQLFAAYNAMADAVQAHVAKDTDGTAAKAGAAADAGRVMAMAPSDGDAEATVVIAPLREPSAPEPTS
jgi:methyl-accepting chemotaxis protein